MRTRTQTKSIKARCLNCSGTPSGVQECQESECSLYLLRFGKRPIGCRPLTAIKQYCDWCTHDMREERINCSVDACPLHPFRFGKKIIVPVELNPSISIESLPVGA